MLNENGKMEVDDWGLLPEGRYQGVCVDIVPCLRKDGGAEGYMVTTNVKGETIDDRLWTKFIESDGSKKKHTMVFKFHHFLRSCGVKSDKRNFEIDKYLVINKPYLVDVIIKEGRYNNISDYFALEKEVPVMPGVPEEEPLKEEGKEEVVTETEDVSEL